MNAPLSLRLGRIFATPGSRDSLDPAGLHLSLLVARHSAGDWGDLDHKNSLSNSLALGNGGRLLSAYRLPTGTKIWVITEADRAATTLLLPEEY